MAETKLQGHLFIGVLRGKEVYISQSGNGHALLVRPGIVSMLSAENTLLRPLGLASTSPIRFYHTQVQPHDLIILTNAQSPFWTDPTLSQLAGLNPSQAVDRLTDKLSQDLSGMVIGIAASGAEIGSPVSKPVALRPGIQSPKDSQIGRDPEVTPLAKPPSKLRISFRNFRRRLRLIFSGISYSLAKIVARLSPGLEEPLPGSYSPRVLAITALVVPLIVVFIASIIYFQRGRGQQFQLNMADARASIAVAESKETPEDAREDWLIAQFYIELAVKYGSDEELLTLQKIIRNALDALDRISRLGFRPVVSGGFGPDAEVNAIAATSTELYVLDSRNRSLWHLWATSQGFEIDGDFQCLDDSANSGAISNPVGISIEPAPSALNAESILAIDKDGNIIYCAPDRIPISSTLTPPEIGWGKITAFKIYNGFLYILDSEQNAIWIYDSKNGIVGGNPTLYFVDFVPDLSETIDLALTQEGLFLLFSDGRVDQCHRADAISLSSGEQSQEVCTPVTFKDDRKENGFTARMPNATPVRILFSPPPEPSLYFLDSQSGAIFQYSTGLIYQGQYQATAAFENELTALTLGPPNNLFVAAGSQVFHAFLNR